MANLRNFLFNTTSQTAFFALLTALSVQGCAKSSSGEEPAAADSAASAGEEGAVDNAPEVSNEAPEDGEPTKTEDSEPLKAEEMSSTAAEAPEKEVALESATAPAATTSAAASPAAASPAASKPAVASAAPAGGAAQAAPKKEASAAAPADPCRASSFKTGAVRSACASGGRPAAKQVMKAAVKKAKDAGTSFKCSSCHTDSSNYGLTGNAQSDLRPWL